MIEEPSRPIPALRKRAKLSLLLSIASYAAVALSFLLDWTVLLLFPICYILAFTAITIAIDQLSSAMKGRIDASSRRLAKASAVLGTASVILMPIGLLQLVAGPDYASPRDVVINDIYNLSAHAYQYRIRPKEMGGGNGSYFGYTLPPKMVKMEFGTYTVSIMHRDTFKITGASLYRKGSVVAYMDSSGGLFKWEYGGEFKEESK